MKYRTYDIIECGDRFQVLCNETGTKTIPLDEDMAFQVCLDLRADPGIVYPRRTEEDCGAFAG